MKYELLYNAVFCNLAFGNIEFMGAVRKRCGEICTYTYGIYIIGNDKYRYGGHKYGAD